MLLGGLDLHRPPLGGYKNRHSALHKKQGKTNCLSKHKVRKNLLCF